MNFGSSALVAALGILTAGLLGCGVTCEREPPLTYANYGQGFLATYCTGCHSSHLDLGDRNEAPLTVNLDSYAGVLLHADRIEARSLRDELDPMPPAGGPDDLDLARLEEWLVCSVGPDAAEADE